MRSRAIPDLDRLLLEAPFVHSLARALAGQDADDVAQNSWLRAMAGPGDAVRQVRSWLTCVVRGVAHNLRRSQRRTRALEKSAADHHRLVPSPAELVERQELRREVLAAVDALADAQRTVVLLRHFEGLTPQQIAHHLGVPVSTVESRLRTAHAHLRRRLNEKHGGRDAWLVPLLPTLGTHPLGSLGVLTMSMSGKVLVGVGAVLLTALALWDLGDPTPPSPMRPDAAVQPVPYATSDHQVQSHPVADATRTAVVDEPPRSSATTGTVLVKAVWGDQIPIPDLPIQARRPGSNPRVGSHCVRTDASGVARIDNLAPGSLYVSNARNFVASVSTRVVAGEEVEVQLVLPVGVKITGIVVDRFDVPVPGAEVCVAGLGALQDAELATITGPDGRFELLGCATECFVGARAASHRSSTMEVVRMLEGSTRDLRLVLLGPGGTVVGTVLGPGHEPVAAAMVAIGKATWGRLDTTPDNALRTIVRTDAQGRFRAVGLAAGEQPIQIRAAGLAPWNGSCFVTENAETSVQAILGAATTCVGIVVDAEGKPVAKANVEVGDWDAFDQVQTSSAADGSFRLEGLSPGAIEVTGHHQLAGTGTVALAGVAGETVRCELRLTPGLTLRGQVLTDEGKPVADATVDASNDGSGADVWGRWVVTDAAGRFVVVQCPEGTPLTVAVHAIGFRSTFAEGVDPRRDDFVVRLAPAPAPTSLLTGRIVTPDGRPVPQAVLEAHEQAGDSSGTTAADDTGAFTLGPLRAGTWSVQIRVPDYPTIWTERREIRDNTRCDLGKIWLPVTGTIRVRLRGAEDLAPVLGVTDGTLAHWTGFSGDGRERRSDPLPPGAHYVSVLGDGIATRLLPIDVRSGEEVAIDVEIVRAATQEFEIVSPIPLTERHIRITQNGTLIAGASSAGRDAHRSHPNYRCNLTPGQYTITVTGNGGSGESDFTIRDGDHAPVRVVLR